MRIRRCHSSVQNPLSACWLFKVRVKVPVCPRFLSGLWPLLTLLPTPLKPRGPPAIWNQAVRSPPSGPLHLFLCPNHIFFPVSSKDKWVSQWALPWPPHLQLRCGFLTASLPISLPALIFFLLKYSVHITLYTFKVHSMWCDTFIHYRMITTVALANISIMSHNDHFLCVVRTFMIVSLSHFKVYKAVVLTIITVLGIRSQKLLIFYLLYFYPWDLSSEYSLSFTYFFLLIICPPT